MSVLKICHKLIPILDLLGPGLSARGGCRPRGRRRLYAFRARLVDEPLRTAILRATEQVIRMGGDGTYRPMRVVRSNGSVRTLQDFFPICSERSPKTGYAMEKGWLQDPEPVGMLPRLVPV